MTSFFFNASGSLDQIGGTIELPAKINYIPFIQGITYTYLQKVDSTEVL